MGDRCHARGVEIPLAISTLVLSACDSSFLHDIEEPIRPTTTSLCGADGPNLTTAEARSDGTVVLTWSFEGEVSQFLVERSTDGNAWSLRADELDARQYQDAAGRDQLLSYRVKADNLTCPPSNVLEVRTAPPPVQGLAATASGAPARVLLSWSDPSILPGTCFRVERTPDLPMGTMRSVEAAFEDTNVEPETTYTYRVTTLYPCDAPTVTSGTDQVPTRTVTTRPAAVVGLMASNVRARTVELDWGDPNATTTGYIIRRSPSDGPPERATQPRFTATGLTPGTDYVFSVTVDSPSGESAAESVMARTSSDPVVALGPPRLEGDCRLVSDLVVTLDSGASSTTSTGSLDLPTLSRLPALQQTPSDVRVELPDGRLDLQALEASGIFDLVWTVTDDLGGTGSATVTSELSVGAPSTVTTVANRLASDFGRASLMGQQPLFDGAEGTCADCRGQPASLRLGTLHACTLLKDADEQTRVACWGSNGNGEAGSGIIAQTLSNPQIACDGPSGGPSPACAPMTDATMVTVGQRFTCVLRSGGEVHCAGSNAFDGLGRGFSDDQFSGLYFEPVCETGSSMDGTCVPLRDVEWVQAGRLRQACAKKTNGDFVCWGGGIGPNPKALCETGLTFRNEPCTPLTDVVGVGMANSVTCFLLGDGTARCLGFNDLGQFGSGSVDASDEPRLELETVCASGTGPTCVPLDDIRSLAGGRDFMCSIRTDQGEVWCWGYNRRGQLGNLEVIDDGVPTPVRACRRGGSDECVPLTGAVQLGLGQEFSCALFEDGTVECWGSQGGDPPDFFNPLGDGLATQPGGRPYAMPVCESGSIAAGGSCTALGKGTFGRMVAVTGGQTSACALSELGGVFCWGGQSAQPGLTSGVLGHGPTFRNAPNPVPVCRMGEGDGACLMQALDDAAVRECYPLSIGD